MAQQLLDDSDMTNIEINTETGELYLEQFMTYRINVLSSLLNRQAERFLSQQFGISLPDWRIVANLGRFRKMSVRDLALRTQMDKALVSRATARLVKRGLVSSRPDKTDGRLVVLALTAAGQRLYKKIMPMAWQHQQQSFDCLTKKERVALERALDKLTAVVRDKEQRRS